ncbi:TonB-dependent receptor [Azoarcus sp. L1K30]|uniref:TonB-dependent receptor n=1 Tax=Azoarcus sp. L1K30 TaxID=2820277 RepID=UPI001B818130|nr:TonB-dependent receptor [Azoarcus sp. L1K30]MBR0568754.1 TonB-dependent receptor [Azoarcus sp. L1K30]
MTQRTTRRRLGKPLCIALAAAFPAVVHCADATLGKVEVVATTPLPGLDVPRDQVPSNVQTVTADALRAKQSLSLPDFMGDRLPGVNINETQGNPFQPDVNYRGFSASPLLGTPQGLSIYLDGVRVNEPFGDTVNWDLIPRVALDSVTLIPGSNPVFGLNTLGGALSLRTRSGFTHPGGAASMRTGAFGRSALEVEQGGHSGDSAYYLAADLSREDGWRDRSPSELRQVFGKLSQRFDNGEIDLTLMRADTDLTGNGLVPESMLARRRSAIFTHPDNTRNAMTLVALSGSLWVDERNSLSATLYHRQTLTRTLNGDANDDFEDGPNNGDCEADDFGAGSADESRCLAANAAGGFNVDSGANNRTRNRQHAQGLALQWIHEADASTLAIGLTHDRSRSDFSQSAQTGVLGASRGVVPGSDIEEENSLDGQTRTTSVYATDTWSLSPALHLTASARYNETRVINRDRLNPDYPNLDGDFTYRKLNPALGLSWQAAESLTVYGGMSQGNRAPSPIELGCADPDNPCTLPNALAADPYLKQVVARSIELGVRGRLANGPSWNAGLYRTINHDDILFVGTSTSAGYFTNFVRTRRQGAELGVSGQRGVLSWEANYSFVQATFQSSACLLAADNSSRGQATACTANGQDDEILVGKGDHLPGIPAHSLKLSLAWQATSALRLITDVVGFSSQYVRGNENNAHVRGEATDVFGTTRNFDGKGRIPAYALLNLAADMSLGGGWTLFGRINNVFDRKYASGGALAENPFDAAGSFLTGSSNWRHETFVAPGAPRSGWIGLRYQWES